MSFRKHNNPDTKALSLTSSGSVGVNDMPFGLNACRHETNIAHNAMNQEASRVKTEGACSLRNYSVKIRVVNPKTSRPASSLSSNDFCPNWINLLASVCILRLQNTSMTQHSSCLLTRNKCASFNSPYLCIGNEICVMFTLRLPTTTLEEPEDLCALSLLPLAHSTHSRCFDIPN